MRVERVGGVALSSHRQERPSGAAADNLLRHAVEAALAVAREGEEETPAVPPPVPLRPFLRFAKLPPRALAATRRVLDSDDEFRARVAEAADEEAVGRPGWLFLTRPEGWEEELRALVTTAEARAEEEVERRVEQDARRRLTGAEQAARRAEQTAAAARADATQAMAALAVERRVRYAAAEEAATAARRVEAVAAERDRVRASAAAAAAEAGSLRRRVADLEAQLQELRHELTGASGPMPRARSAGRELAGPEVAGREVVGRPAPSASPPPESPFGGSAEVVGRALREAASAAARLAEALASAAAPLADAPPGGDTVVGVDPPAASAVATRAPGRRRSEPAGRKPVLLPPAVYDDSLEAAEHLVRVSGAALVVDGYNVSQTGWPDEPLAEQRRRLVAALAELAARTGVDVRVVFDGADLATPGIVPTTAQSVRVSFSAPGVEADDEVLAMVNDLPVHRAVVVATSDRAVQQGAAKAGANVISSPQLLAVLRR